MGKLARLAAVNNAKTESFVYIPPQAAFGATRILVKANIGTIKSPPVTVSMTVLGAVLRGLRRANPLARILIMDGVTGRFPAEEVLKASGLLEIMDDNTRLADAEAMPMDEYPNPLAEPYKFASMTAPEMFGDYECRISVSTFKRTIQPDGQPLVMASMENLYGLFPREMYSQPENPHERGQFLGDDAVDVFRDLYFCAGRLFDGAVVDLDTILLSDNTRLDKGESQHLGQVVWGDDLLAVDEVACRLAEQPVPDYIKTLNGLRASVQAH